jgi:putative ubiquitin-RnfH superfamily antitoxin RatB of RatAB toxin-antitoxin module
MANPLGVSMSVEVIYALPHRAIRKVFDIAAPATVEAVLCLAAADPEFAAIDTKNCTAGVFGQVARADHILRPGDRIELYRQLTADPKNARRERVKEARKRRR